MMPASSSLVMRLLTVPRETPSLRARMATLVRAFLRSKASSWWSRLSMNVILT
jgi:hypothetical protein